MTGRLRTGTSGFAYPGWAPRFYPPGARGEALLRFDGSGLGTVELNNTCYRQPSPSAVDGWLAATPSDFRFAVKAQRGGSFRSLQVDPTDSVPWLTGPLRRFGERLGTVLFRVPDGVRRSDERLAALLAAWPVDLPIAMEFQDPSWHVDETFAALRGAGAALVATDLPDDPELPTIRRTGPVPDLVAHRDLAAPRDHVVDLVLGVRLLTIGLAGAEDVQADRQVGDRDELEVGPTARVAPGDEIGELEGVHARHRTEPQPGGDRRIPRCDPSRSSAQPSSSRPAARRGRTAPPLRPARARRAPGGPRAAVRRPPRRPPHPPRPRQRPPSTRPA